MCMILCARSCVCIYVCRTSMCSWCVAKSALSANNLFVNVWVTRKRIRFVVVYSYVQYVGMRNTLAPLARGIDGQLATRDCLTYTNTHTHTAHTFTQTDDCYCWAILVLFICPFSATSEMIENELQNVCAAHDEYKIICMVRWCLSLCKFIHIYIRTHTVGVQVDCRCYWANMTSCPRTGWCLHGQRQTVIAHCQWLMYAVCVLRAFYNNWEKSHAH